MKREIAKMKANDAKYMNHPTLFEKSLIVLLGVVLVISLICSL